MKSCPTCGTLYTDETLRFCLQDGAVLGPAPATQPPTASPSDEEVETAVRPRGPVPETSVATQWKQESGETQVRAKAPSSSGRGTRIAVAAVLIAMVLLLLAGAAGVGLYLYLRDPGRYVANTNDNRNGAFDSNNANTRTPTPTRTPAPSPTATVSNLNTNTNGGPTSILPTDEDRQRISREISTEVYSWKDDTESGDIDSQIRRYAPSVAYYRRSGASPAFIRADKMRAYRVYDSIEITISNMNVTVGMWGLTATAEFDKEWVFDGTRRSTGKVRQQLQFQKINGRWLITAERDVKVYYTG